MTVKGAVGLLAGFLVLAIWGYFALNYSDAAIAGTYSLGNNDVVLGLTQDHSYKEVVQRDGQQRIAIGTWRKIGEARLVFSAEFITVPGQNARANGEADGEFRRQLGIFRSIKLGMETNGPVLRRR